MERLRTPQSDVLRSQRGRKEKERGKKPVYLELTGRPTTHSRDKTQWSHIFCVLIKNIL